jgi:hypothetical protein
MRKIIFLDNDGVICLSNNWGSRHNKLKKWMFHNDNKASYDMDHRFDDFDTKAIKVFNEILTETGADYVISSDWKIHATLEELQGYYLLKGVIKAPIALTPNLKDFDEDAAAMFGYRWEFERMRCLEIKEWLKQNPDVTHWVAVDDLNMSNENLHPGLDNFVLTPRSNEGIKQSGIKEKILKHLL